MKKSKNEKCIFEPQKNFFIQNLCKNFVLLKKFDLQKYLQNIKKSSGEKVRAPQNHGNRLFLGFWGALTFPPERFFNILRTLL